MESLKIKVLIVDDDKEDYLLTKHYLLNINTVEYKVEWEDEYDAAIEKIRECQHDVYFVDYNLRGKSGVELVRSLVDEGFNVPFIFLTGMNNYKIDLEAMKAGATDYLIKSKINEEILERSIRYAIRQKDIENKLIESNNTKSKLFSIISHDLRSPFNALMQIVDVLEEGTKLPQELYVTLVQHIKNDSKATYELLQNILSWAQNETSTIQYNPEKNYLHSLIGEVIEQMLPLAKGKKITITNNISCGIKVFVDHNMIMLVVRNLLSNALKFTNNGGTICFNAIRNTEVVEIAIKDNGVGMNEDVLKNIFRKDSFVSSKGTNNEKGSGLGLKLCHEFVLRHNGEIWVESEPGIGSTFYFTIPVI